MSKYSIVTVVSDPNVYNKCLLQSLTKVRFGYDIEIIPILNTNDQYSACDALNIGLDAARSDIVIIAHQDISFLDGWFYNLEKTIKTIGDEWGVIGTAGIQLCYTRKDISRWGGPQKLGIITAGQVWGSVDELNNQPYWNGTKEVVKVHCVDECLFVINRSVGLRFDPIFTGFHFYGVDVCLQARAAMFGVYCSNLPIIHHGEYSSSFSNTNRYWHYLRLLYNKWKWQFPELLGTHFHWSTKERKTLIGGIEIVPEIISYINTELTSDDGLWIAMKSLGISEVRLRSDQQYGII